MAPSRFKEVSDMRKEIAPPDYQYIEEQSLKAYDVIAALTFETCFNDKEGGKLVSKACTAIAELFRYAKEKKENGK